MFYFLLSSKRVRKTFVFLLKKEGDTMKKVLLTGLLVVFFGLFLAGISYAAHIHATLEGFYGGSCTLDGEYQIKNPEWDDYEEDYTVTCVYDNFSIIPNVSISGTVNIGFVEGEFDDCDKNQITGENITLKINGVPYRLDMNITYYDCDDEEITISLDSYLKINGSDVLLTGQLIEILSNLLYWGD